MVLTGFVMVGSLALRASLKPPPGFYRSGTSDGGVPACIAYVRGYSGMAMVTSMLNLVLVFNGWFHRAAPAKMAVVVFLAMFNLAVLQSAFECYYY
jgi:hypothetical protein